MPIRGVKSTLAWIAPQRSLEATSQHQALLGEGAQAQSGTHGTGHLCPQLTSAVWMCQGCGHKHIQSCHPPVASGDNLKGAGGAVQPSTAVTAHSPAWKHNLRVRCPLCPCEDKGAAGDPKTGAEPKACTAGPWCSLSYLREGSSHC